LTLECTPGSNLPSMNLKVSQLAEKAGVSADTVRYYEKEGLLVEPGRTHSGYRQYDEAAIERLHFIRGAQTLGLKLADIKELLDIRDRGACPCGHTRQLLEKRVAQIYAEIRDLRALKRELQSMERLDCPTDSGSSPWPCEIEFVKRGGERVG
jgi:DNA-binding transcriptional MerR regulator